MSHLPSYFCRRRVDTKFYDTCGKPLTYARWRPGQPDDYQGRENCGKMHVNGAQKAKWNDNDCNNKYGYICQIKLPRCRYLVFHLCKNDVS